MVKPIEQNSPVSPTNSTKGKTPPFKDTTEKVNAATANNFSFPTSIKASMNKHEVTPSFANEKKIRSAHIAKPPENPASSQKTNAAANKVLKNNT